LFVYLKLNNNLVKQTISRGLLGMTTVSCVNVYSFTLKMNKNISHNEN